jgi:hypothetical protein
MVFKPQALGLVRARITQSLSAEQSPLQHASYLQLLIDAILLQPSIVERSSDTTSYPVPVSTRPSLSSPDVSLSVLPPVHLLGQRRLMEPYQTLFVFLIFQFMFSSSMEFKS